MSQVTHKCETELTRQTDIGFIVKFDYKNRYIAGRHNVGQTDKGQFEVSLSYLCPSHLWH